jgi:hypothetical protein
MMQENPNLVQNDEQFKQKKKEINDEYLKNIFLNS